MADDFFRQRMAQVIKSRVTRKIGEGHDRDRCLPSITGADVRGPHLKRDPQRGYHQECTRELQRRRERSSPGGLGVGRQIWPSSEAVRDDKGIGEPQNPLGTILWGDLH